MRLPLPNPDVIYKAVESGAVLLFTRDEVYYGLNTVGTFVWEHLPPVCHTLEDLSVSLDAVYPKIPAHTIRSDVRELLAELLAYGLVCPPAETDDATSESGAPQEADRAAPQRVG